MSDVGSIVQAILMPVALIVVAWIGKRKIDEVKSPVVETLRQTTEINHAVNGKDPRATTISEDVTTIRAKQEKDTPSDVGEGEDALLPLVRRILDRLDASESTSKPKPKPRRR